MNSKNSSPSAPVHFQPGKRFRRTALALACAALAANPLLGSERVVWTEGHGDLTFNYLAGTWEFGVAITALPGEVFRPDEVLVTARDNARLAIPANANFAFLGAPGEPVWVYPQSQTAGVPFVGMNTEATPAGTFTGASGGRLDLLLNRVSGPGPFYLWTAGGGGTPTIWMNSTDGFSEADRFELPSGHVHANWGFTSPGTHQVGFRTRGTLTSTGETVTSDEVAYTFEVGVLKEGEVDLEVAYENGALEFHVLDEATGTELAPAHVALQAGPNTWTVVPEDPAFAFLGPPGAALQVLPQEETPGQLFLGLGAELPAGLFAGDELSIRLASLEGPGNVALYAVDAFGAPTIHWNSADGLTEADAFTLSAASHTHANWAFTAPGIYRLGLQAVGTLTAGGTVTGDPTVFLFEVFPPTRLERGEIDLEMVYADGAWELALLDEAAGREYGADEAVLVARPPARQRVPESPEFSFLGAPGETVFVLPQEERAELLFLGIAADEIQPGLFTDETVRLKLAAMTGPGEVALYEVDAFGVPTVFWNSRDGLTEADALPITVGSHTHLNLAFSRPGLYRLGLQAAGTRVVGQQPALSEVIEFRVEVRAPVEFAEGELDFEVVYKDGEWELVFLDEANEAEFETDEVLLIVRPAAAQPVPTDPAFAFLGAPGATVHILPQEETAGLLFPGLAGDELPPGEFAGEVVRLELLAMRGPGEFALYAVDAFGGPTVFMNTRDGVDGTDVFPLAVGTHTHLNWAFSAPGEYQLDLRAAATRVAGNEPVASEPVTLYVLVETAGPRLSVIRVNGGATLRLGWDSRSGASYQPQSRTNLAAGGWDNEGEPLDGTGEPLSVEAPITSEPLKVFQVLEVTP